MTAEKPVAAETGPTAGDPMKVLLVDDQLMIGEALRRTLADEPGIEFYFCSEPTTALVTAERISPTVILQDLVLPGVDGLVLVREYRAHEATRDIPVIVLSTREEPKTKSDAFAAGANDYLVKLPDKVELLARIRYHSQAYLGQRQRDAAYRALRESQQQLMAANAELQRLTNMDGLTSLNNRRRFDEYAMTEWRRGLREQSPFAMLLLDVDHFKLYNDTYGHLAGDEVLKRVAAAIRGSCGRPADLPARYGGEEFAVVLPGTRGGGANHLAERVRQAVYGLAIPHSASSAGPFVSVSVGGYALIPSR